MLVTNNYDCLSIPIDIFEKSILWVISTSSCSIFVNLCMQSDLSTQSRESESQSEKIRSPIWFYNCNYCNCNCLCCLGAASSQYSTVQ